MNQIDTEVKKIIVLGSPGSGKSYFSDFLYKKYNYPLFHLDDIYWEKDWVSLNENEFQKNIQNILKLEEYIIDGNYYNSIEIRAKHADIIYIIDTPLYLCIIRIIKRSLENVYLDGKHLPKKIKNAHKHTIQKPHKNLLKFILHTIDFHLFKKKKMIKYLSNSFPEKVVKINKNDIRSD